MRKVPLLGAVVVLVLSLAGVVSFAAASQAAGPSSAKSQTLVFDMVFCPFEFVQVNIVRNPNSPFSLGDETVAHDKLFSHGKLVGDDAITNVIVSLPPDNVVVLTTGVFRLPGGSIAVQALTTPGPAHKQLAVTGGTDSYANFGGDGTLIEFNQFHGKLILHLLSLVARGGGS